MMTYSLKTQVFTREGRVTVSDVMSETAGRLKRCQPRNNSTESVLFHKTAELGIGLPL